MRPHGAATSTRAALSWTFTATAGSAHTAVAIGLNAQLRGIVPKAQLRPRPAGHGPARIIQAARGARHADIYT